MSPSTCPAGRRFPITICRTRPAMSTERFPEGVDITQDGHYAIFGDSSLASVIEVSDISSGVWPPRCSNRALAGHLGGDDAQLGSIRLSPDESMIFIGNNDGGSVAAAFFDKRTGKVSAGCQSPSLAGFYNPWAFSDPSPPVIPPARAERCTSPNTVLPARSLAFSTSIPMARPAP